MLAPVEASTLDAIAKQHYDAIMDVSTRHSPPVTLFEAVTGIAYRALANEAIDVGVIEVGIGGEFDATNIFTADQLLAAVVTPVSLEHADMLGDTPRAIALTKSKIMKTGRPCVLAR